MKSFMKAANSLAFAAIMGLLHSAMDEMYFLFLKSMISWKELVIFLEKFLDCKGWIYMGIYPWVGLQASSEYWVHLAELRSA